MATAFVGRDEPSGNEDNLQTDDFYPQITTAKLQSETRNDVELQAAELTRHLKSAIYSVNEQLSVWRSKQTVNTLAEVSPLESHLSGEQLAAHYTAAVLLTAKVSILKNYRDASTTGQGHEVASAADIRIGEYQAQAWTEYRAILGKGFLDVELI